MVSSRQVKREASGPGIGAVRAALSGTFAAVGDTTPGVVGHPVALAQQPGITTWLGANVALYNRFTLGSRSRLRYALFTIGVQSGNIQVGLVQMSGTGKLDYTRVMDSGVIACPATGHQRLDLGAIDLPPGDYATFFWADNATVTVPRATASSTSTLLRSNSIVTGLVAGVPASGSLADWSDQRYTQVAIEGDDPL